MSNYKQLTKKLIWTILAVPAMFSCSDWTDVESLDYQYVLPSEQNPEAYETYLSLLKEYKQNPHKILVAKFDNSGYSVSGQADHLSALPDSTDFIVLQAADGLNPLIEQEMTEVKTKKGTRTLYCLNYADVEERLQAILDNEEAEEVTDENEGTANDTDESEDTSPEQPAPDRFVEICNLYTDSLLALYDKYGYDGIVMTYPNVASPTGMTEEERAQLQVRQGAFFGKVKTWAADHPDATIIFEGKPENVLDTSIFKLTDFIAISIPDAVSSSELIWNVEMALTEGVPSDRVLFGVTIPSRTDEKSTDGYFNGSDEDGNSEYAVIGAAYTVISSDGNFVKAGLCVDNVRDDYFQPEFTYSHVRRAIQIMN